MIFVYTETNFVLELALEQEQSESCEKLIKLHKYKNIRLIIPAYCFIEPYETQIRHHKKRRSLNRDISIELKQLARSRSYKNRANSILDKIDPLFIESIERECRKLEEIKSYLLDNSDVIPLSNQILRNTSEYQKEHNLSPQDATVYASVLYHLKQTKNQIASCFLNKKISMILILWKPLKNITVNCLMDLIMA